MNTRKYPRTLNEAFGPYTSRDFVDDTPPPMPLADRVVVITCAVGAVALFAIALAGWL